MDADIVTDGAHAYVMLYEHSEDSCDVIYP
jgi:hypothetical protein